MEWHEKLGFDEDPFNLDPLETDYELIGRDKEKEELLYRIVSGNMLLIEGKAGTGKTHLLKYAIDNFRGKGRVIYVDGDKLNKRLDIERLLVNKYGLIKGKLLKKKPKGMVLLLDNVQYLSRKNNDKIKFYFDQDYLKSVVFTTTDYKLVNFNEAIKARIGNNKIKLKNLKSNGAIRIVKERLGGEDITPSGVLRTLYRKSNKNIMEFLVNCGMLCEYAAKRGKEKATKEDIGEILKLKKKERKKENNTTICPECGEDLEEIKEHWRCRNCDRYCKKCGSLVDYEDNECLMCGKLVEG